jgi:hypothetical protein
MGSLTGQGPAPLSQPSSQARPVGLPPGCGLALIDERLGERGLAREDMDRAGWELRESDAGWAFCVNFRHADDAPAERRLLLGLTKVQGNLRWAPGALGKGAVLVLGEPHRARLIVIAEGESDGMAAWRHLHRCEDAAVLVVPGATMVGDDLANFIGANARVVLATDADPSGDRCAEQARRVLLAAGVTNVIRYRPAANGMDKPDLRDVVEALERSCAYQGRDTADALRALLDAPGLEPDADNVGVDDEVGTEAARPGPVLVRVSEVTPEPITWLWPGRIALGKLTVLDGDPGLGKSTLMLDIAARVSTGSPMPGGTERGEVGGVVILSAEDGLADTIRPRLDAAGADCERVAVMTGIREEDGEERPVLIPEDLPALEKAIESAGARLVVIDPLMAFLSGGINAHHDQDVRRALAAMARLGERTGAAIVIVRHLNKSGGSNPIYRGGGSIGIIGAARSGMLVAGDPDNDRQRVLAMTKSNIAGAVDSLAFKLVPHASGVAQVTWAGSSPYAASDLLAGSTQETPAVEAAKAFLVEFLHGGPRLVREVQDAAKSAGHATKTLRTARERLGIASQREGFGKGARYVWTLPASTRVPLLSKEAPGDRASMFDLADGHASENPLAAKDEGDVDELLEPMRAPVSDEGQAWASSTGRETTILQQSGDAAANAQRSGDAGGDAS